MVSEVQRARTDPIAFFEQVMRTADGRPFAVADFHREWMTALERHPRVLILAPRGHGKTNLLMARLLWEVGRDPNLRTKVASNSDKNARKLLGEIKQTIERSPVCKMIFPDLKPSSWDWAIGRASVERQTTSKDPTFEAAGIFSSVVGGRSNILVFDDTVDLRNSVMFPQLQQTLRSKFLGEWLPMLEPGGRAWVIGTPWAQNDLYAFLRRNPEWEVLDTPVGTDADPFQPLWPEVFPAEVLRRQYTILGPFEYDRAYRCRALADDAAPIRPEWIHYYDADAIGDLDKVNTYVCVQAFDLAIAQTASADFFAWVTLLYDPERNLIFVADAQHARLPFTDQAAMILEQAKQWSPARQALEVGGYQGALAQYLQQNAGAPLPIVPVRARGSKHRRLLELTPLFQQRRVLFHPNLDPQRDVRLSERGNVVGELLGFGRERHDDLVDAMVYAVQVLRDYMIRDDEEDGFTHGEGVDARVSVVG